MSGRVLPELKIVDDTGQEVPQGEIGTLMVKGNSDAQQYWRKREKTKTTMQGQWLNTGDKYYIDKDGYYWCGGRADDMIKAGGIWVSPVEVENCLNQHPAVKECAVISSPDNKGLLKPKAYVVLRDGYEDSEELKEELKKWALDRLAKFKYPRWIEIVAGLPKSATGKIQRFKLREKNEAIADAGV
jgi:benzoate-CoA ligase